MAKAVFEGWLYVFCFLPVVSSVFFRWVSIFFNGLSRVSGLLVYGFLVH